MKANDFAPRTGAIEAYLTGHDLIGAEVGVDVGAHVESLLRYCDIKKIWLIDPWLNDYCQGYCAGRLSRWKNKICMEKAESAQAAKLFEKDYFDFIYLDQQHDYDSVAEDFRLWWPLLKGGGIMALRNYNGNPGLKKAADEFVVGKKYEVENYLNELLVFK